MCACAYQLELAPKVEGGNFRHGTCQADHTQRRVLTDDVPALSHGSRPPKCTAQEGTRRVNVLDFLWPGRKPDPWTTPRFNNFKLAIHSMNFDLKCLRSGWKAVEMKKLIQMIVRTRTL